jgi:Sortase domain
MPTRTPYDSSMEKKPTIFRFIPIFLLIGALIFAGFVWYNKTQKPKQEIRNILQNSNTKPSTKSDDKSKTIQDPTGENLTEILKKANIDMGFVNTKVIKELQQNLPITEIDIEKVDVSKVPERPTLEGVVPAPQKPDQKNLILWEKYGIKAPISNAAFQDLYQGKSDGTVDFAKSVDNNPTFSPVQQLLTKGIVHLPFSPQPGEVGNSYIIGHSSNYITVKSDFNEVFKPLLDAANPGEEFYIFDHKGRKLKFRVFESIAVKEEDVKEAYKNFGDRRVVTLQGSILETVNGQILPTKRWLVRAELVLN